MTFDQASREVSRQSGCSPATGLPANCESPPGGHSAAVCTPCATVGVSCTGGHLVQSGTRSSCRPRREHHVSKLPPPHPKSTGAWEVAGPTPQLFACCCSSQLFPSLVFLVLVLGLGPGPFLPTSPPPVLPLHRRPFQPFRLPTLSATSPSPVFCPLLAPNPVIISRICLPIQANLHIPSAPPLHHPLPGLLEQTLLSVPYPQIELLCLQEETMALAPRRMRQPARMSTSSLVMVLIVK